MLPPVGQEVDMQRCAPGSFRPAKLTCSVRHARTDKLHVNLVPRDALTLVEILSGTSLLNGMRNAAMAAGHATYGMMARYGRKLVSPTDAHSLLQH